MFQNIFAQQYGSFKDSRDGKVYKTVKIGDQVWMAENLNTDRFRNGDLILEAKTNEDWENACKNKQPAWCYYENNPNNEERFGKLYNWYAIVDSRGLSPEGWHLGSEKEKNELIVRQKESGEYMKVTFEFNYPQSIASLCWYKIDSFFIKALNNAIAKKYSTEQNFIVLFLSELESIVPITKFYNYFSLHNLNGFKNNKTKAEVKNFLNSYIEKQFEIACINKRKELEELRVEIFETQTYKHQGLLALFLKPESKFIWRKNSAGELSEPFKIVQEQSCFNFEQSFMYKDFGYRNLRGQFSGMENLWWFYIDMYEEAVTPGNFAERKEKTTKTFIGKGPSILSNNYCVLSSESNFSGPGYIAASVRFIKDQ
jgi:uncharacterized protein (TIGR02145 family)